MRKSYLVGILCASLLAFSTTSSCAASIGYSGTLEHIFVDNGTGTYAGALIGDSYSGNFSTGNSVSDGTPILPCLNDECEYDFSGPSFTSSVSNGVLTETGSGSLIAIWDGYDLETDDAAFINVLPGISWAVGTLLDGWLGDAVLDNGIQLGLGFITQNTSLYSSLGYQALPPGITNSATELAFFTIEEFDGSGNTIFLGFGRLNSVSVVPVPAALWLFSSGLLALIGVSRRKNMAL